MSNEKQSHKEDSHKQTHKTYTGRQTAITTSTKFKANFWENNNILILFT